MVRLSEQQLQQKKAELEKLLELYLKEQAKMLDGLHKDDREALGTPIKDVRNLDSFTANGNVYFVRTSLCIERFERFEILQSRVGFGVDFANLYGNMHKAFTCLEKSKPASASVIIHNIMSGVKSKIDERENPVLELCALFISREGEDLTTLDEALQKQKIQDWREEGIDMSGFFSLASNLVDGFIPVLNEASQDIFQAVKAAKK